MLIDIQKRLNAPSGKMDLKFHCHIHENEWLAIYGPSGAGKTSILRMISGLMKPDAGKISFKKEVWFSKSKKINTKPRLRNVGFVFQDYALFPNMTVLENLKYAQGKNEDKIFLNEILEVSQLGDLIHKKPSVLSGGQQQRVALVRALVQKPRILLLDEPLSALDEKTRLGLQDYLLEIKKEIQLRVILVSHDKNEIKKLADRVVVLGNGEIIQEGKPETIFPGKEGVEGVVIDKRMKDSLFFIVIQTKGSILELPVSKSKFDATPIGDKIQLFLE